MQQVPRPYNVLKNLVYSYILQRKSIRTCAQIIQCSRNVNLIKKYCADLLFHKLGNGAAGRAIVISVFNYR